MPPNHEMERTKARTRWVRMIAAAGAVCECPCHIGGPVAHPVPCCTACERCHIPIPTGGTHECLGAFHPRTMAVHGRGLLRALIRLDLAFSAIVGVLVMALALLSLPRQGSIVLLGAVLVGAAFGIGLIVRQTARRRSAGGDHGDD